MFLFTFGFAIDAKLGGAVNSLKDRGPAETSTKRDGQSPTI